MNISKGGNIVFEKGQPIGEKVISLYLTILFTLFPLYLPAARILGLSLRWFLFAILTGIAAVTYVYLLFKKRTLCRKRIYKSDLCMAALLLFSMWMEVWHAFRGKDIYETYLLMSVSVLAYFLISAAGSGQEFQLHYYLDFFMVACAIIYCGLLIRLLWLPGFDAPIGLLTEDKGTTTAFLILSIVVAVLQYCGNRVRRLDKGYVIIAAAGFLLLFIQQDIISILLICALFLSIPLFYIATAELIKKVLILVFLYFLILCNLPFIVQIGIFKTDLQFDFRISIYLDLLVAAMGVLLLSYWERLPKGIPLEVIVMNRLRRMFGFTLMLCTVIVAAVLCIAPYEGMDEGIGGSILSGLADSVKKACLRSESSFKQALVEYGTAGFILAAIIFVIILSQIRKKYGKEIRRAELTIFTVMFVLQSFFYKQQTVTTPIYIAIVTIALFQEKNKEEHNEKLQRCKRIH